MPKLVELAGREPVQILSLSKREMELCSYWAQGDMDKQMSLIFLAGIAEDPRLGDMSPAEIDVELDGDEGAVNTLLNEIIDYSEPFRLSRELRD